MGATVNRESVITRGDRQYVLYAGLLDEAHRQGLKAIRTTLLQIPTEENGYVAICQAVVETEKGVFTGIGDASPANVSRQMVHCLIRMAETRAKARALRDAVNVGVVALEELDDLEEEPAPERRPADSPARATTEPGRETERPVTPLRTERPADASDPATPAQLRAIYSIGRDLHALSEAQIEERCLATYGCPPTELSKRQASEFITRLKTAGRNGRESA